MDIIYEDSKNNIFSDFDERIENIMSIKEKYPEEAVILIYSYLDFLSAFTEKTYQGNENHRANFRKFLMNYSDKCEILTCLQVDKFYNHCK